MTRVVCTIDQIDMENDEGRRIDGVQATCGLCGHQTESFGTSSISVRRCLVLLHEECPEHSEDNYYVADGGEDDQA